VNRPFLLESGPISAALAPYAISVRHGGTDTATVQLLVAKEKHKR
jgi:hypothetical protein